MRINADAVLSLSVAPECFEPVPRRHAQIFKPHRSVQKLQFVQRSLLDLAWQFFGKLLLPDSLSLRTFKTNNQ
jgi:hypothetical protein